MVHYPMAPHRQFGFDYDLPSADAMADTVLSLPLGNHLTENDLKKIVQSIREFV